MYSLGLVGAVLAGVLVYSATFSGGKTSTVNTEVPKIAAPKVN